MKKKLALLISILLLPINLLAAEDITLIKQLENNLENCSKNFLQKEYECPDIWSIRCYDEIIDLHHQTQKCYNDIAYAIYTKFYNNTKLEALDRIDKFNKQIYKQYSYIYSESKYCEKNCGISYNLYSEYATTQYLQTYLKKILVYLKTNQ